MKKGLSTIVVTVLLVLLAIVALGIVWYVIRNVVENSKDADITEFKVTMEINKAQLVNNNAEVEVTVSRKTGTGNITGLRFVLFNGTSSQIYENMTGISELQTRIYKFPVTISNPVKVEIYPITIVNNKNRVLNKIVEKNFGAVTQVPAPEPGECFEKSRGELCNSGAGICDGASENCVNINLDTNLVSYYDFDNNVSDKKDGNHGTIMEVQSWTDVQNMNTFPTSPWTNAKSSGNTGSITNNGSDLTINSAGIDPFYFYEYNLRFMPAFNFATGFTIEFRMKINVANNNINTLYVWNGNNYVDLFFNLDGKSVSLDDVNYVDIGSTATYHKYRITVKDNVVKLYVDNVLISTGSTFYSQTSQNLIHFGDVESGSGSGTLTYDYVVFSLNGADVPANYVSGIKNQAISFDGVNDYVKVEDSPSLSVTGQLTISSWIRKNVLYGNLIVSKTKSEPYDPTGSREYSYEFGNNHGQCNPNEVYLLISGVRDSDSNYAMACSNPISDTKWHNVVGTFLPGQSMKIYIDGLDQTRTVVGTVPSQIADCALPLYIGQAGNPGNYFNGIIDNIRMYNKALNSDEVLFMNNTKS